MAIVIKKDKAGRRYGINTKTGKRVTLAYAEKMGKFQRFSARPKGKPSVAACSTAGSDLKVKKTSTAGSLLARCGSPSTYKAYFAKKKAGVVKNRKGFKARKK
jgi:hypothetical protein